jgi:hypothetical protein
MQRMALQLGNATLFLLRHDLAALPSPQQTNNTLPVSAAAHCAPSLSVAASFILAATSCVQMFGSLHQRKVPLSGRRFLPTQR